MDIFIARGEERNGPYSEERARSLLAQGLLNGNELARYEGRADWTAIREILNNLPTPEKPLAAVPASKSFDNTQVAREQTREETVTQKASKTSEDKWDLLLLPYFAIFCLFIVTGLAGLVIYLIWSAIRPA